MTTDHPNPTPEARGPRPSMTGNRAHPFEPEAERPPHPAPAVLARGLTKTYGERRAVDGIDLTIGPGEIFGFLGPNGAGKSTTIAMLCALTPPTAGRARVAGADVVRQPQQVRRQIGLLLQDTALDADMSLARNLYLHARLHQLPRPLARARTTEVLELADLADRRHHKVRTLSGGMRRRLEIARALLHQPRVLFLDEPTTGLDPHARARIWHHLTQLRDRTGTTLYVTTHYLEEAEHCDRAAVIDHGRIVAVGTPADLKAQIGEDRIRLHTDNDTAAVAALRDLGLRPARTGDGLTLRVADSARTVPLVVAALADRQLALRALAVTPPTLDEVFFHHTGRSTDTDPGTEPLESK
ncbi:ABC transporter ATP-binding protein [Streptomyces smyrnaeus]|nr:ATP-binding cassette domain-containing protein [Streptomyces smyrnaeus]